MASIPWELDILLINLEFKLNMFCEKQGFKFSKFNLYL